MINQFDNCQALAPNPYSPNPLGPTPTKSNTVQNKGTGAGTNSYGPPHRLWLLHIDYNKTQGVKLTQKGFKVVTKRGKMLNFLMPIRALAQCTVQWADL